MGEEKFPAPTRLVEEGFAKLEALRGSAAWPWVVAKAHGAKAGRSINVGHAKLRFEPRTLTNETQEAAVECVAWAQMNLADVLQALKYAVELLEEATPMLDGVRPSLIDGEPRRVPSAAKLEAWLADARAFLSGEAPRAEPEGAPRESGGA